MSAQLLNHVSAFFLLGVVLFVLAVFVFLKNPKIIVNQIFAFYSSSIAWWSIFTIPMITTSDFDKGLFWDRVCLMGTIFIPSTFIHFVTAFLRKIKEFKWLIVICYLLSIYFLFQNISGNLVQRVQPHYVFLSYTVPTFHYHALVTFFSLMSTFGVYLLFRGYKAAQHIRAKKQLRWLFLTSLLGYLGGAFNFLIIYGIVTPLLTDFSNYAVLLYGLSIAYIILKYNFLEIDVIIRRTIIFAGLVSFVFGVFALVTFITQEILSNYIHAGRFTINLVSVLLIVIGYDPLRSFLMNITDKFLFQKKFDYQKLLKDATQGMSKIKSLEHLCRLVTHFITMRVRVKNAGVLARDLGTDTFYFNYGRGYEAPPLLKTLHITDPLIQFLQDEHESLDLEKIKEWIEAKEPTGTEKEKKYKKKYDFKTIKNHMEVMRAGACIPSFLGRELRNVLVLGEKKSGDFFTEEDLNVLYTLAQESAIAIENARLYDEAIFKTKELEGINRQLEIAQSNLIGALNETELANKRLQDTQAQLIHEQKMATLGRLASSVGHEVNNPLTILSMNVSRAILKYRKNPDLKVNDILDVFQKMEQNIGRIKAVVNTLTGLLKKSEKGKFEPLSLKLVLEETLPLVQFQTYLDNLSGTEVEFDIPGNTPLIRGDLERLQEVFLNLFINAYHAMAGRRDRKIKVNAKHGEGPLAKMVVVEFADNGSGMSEEVMKKIFQYGFTTKPVGKGSGMGLYMCRYIVELHGGDVKVRSKPGEGTTFVITLPIFEEETSIQSNEIESKKGNP